MIPQQTHFGLEQPASPKSHLPEVVNFWDTEEWSQLKEEFGWGEVQFDQGKMGGLASKKTTVGGSLELKVEDFVRSGNNFRRVKDSKELSRWAQDLWR